LFRKRKFDGRSLAEQALAVVYASVTPNPNVTPHLAQAVQPPVAETADLDPDAARYLAACGGLPVNNVALVEADKRLLAALGFRRGVSIEPTDVWLAICREAIRDGWKIGRMVTMDARDKTCDALGALLWWYGYDRRRNYYANADAQQIMDVPPGWAGTFQRGYDLAAKKRGLMAARWLKWYEVMPTAQVYQALREHWGTNRTYPPHPDHPNAAEAGTIYKYMRRFYDSIDEIHGDDYDVPYTPGFRHGVHMAHALAAAGLLDKDCTK
jgi:hypothetical protein